MRKEMFQGNEKKMFYTIKEKVVKQNHYRETLWTGVVYCKVLVKKCQGAYSTQWRYIVHVINSNQGHAIYSVTSNQFVLRGGGTLSHTYSQFLYTGMFSKVSEWNRIKRNLRVEF